MEALAHSAPQTVQTAPRGEARPYSIDDLIAQVRESVPAGDLAIVRRAYEFAAAAHGDQRRKSGEPYINHPLRTARILADLHLDPEALAAALLHDVPEDTGTPLDRIEQEFGPTVARLVDGVTKLSKLKLYQLEERRAATGDSAATWAENLRKMFLAMADDIRVVLIKLADRLHNMTTLMFLPVLKRRRIAQETLEIYAPLAGRLGIYQIKWQLEDLAFRYLHPDKYKELAAKLALGERERKRYLAVATRTLREELERHGIKAEVSSRPKHIYSIWRKMQRRGVEFDQIYDLHAVRVLVDDVGDCYTVLGYVHQLWRPIPGQFDDYIAMPKESMYQSLHTTVIGPEGKPLEIQIRTYEMHRTAEYGVAAHWRYKEGARRNLQYEEKLAWLRQLMDWQKDLAGGAEEFVESLKTDIFKDQVYVFTPKGEIKDLPAGATPLDFAYRIHTDVGHRCVGAKVNGKLVSLDTALKNGDIVEILTSKNPKGPSRDWLNPALGYIHTHHAREKIRQWFKRQQREENIARGREQLDKELDRLGMGQMPLEEVARLFKYEKLDEFLAMIGVGEITSQQIAAKIAATQAPPAPPAPYQPPLSPTSGSAAAPSTIRVRGVGDLLTKLARCCTPVPGDRIVGYITRGKGITVHRADCQNIAIEDEPERLIEVAWDVRGQQTYPVTIRVEAWDRAGLLRDVTSVVAEEKVNITQASTQTQSDHTATIWVTVEVADLAKLSRIFGKLEGIKDVISVTRDGSGAAHRNPASV